MKASFVSWSCFCFNKEYVRGWIYGFIDTSNIYPLFLVVCKFEVVGLTLISFIELKIVVFTRFFVL